MWKFIILSKPGASPEVTDKEAFAKEIDASNPHDSNEQIQTDNGEFCVFPFVHKGITYFHCTADDEPLGIIIITKQRVSDECRRWNSLISPW